MNIAFPAARPLSAIDEALVDAARRVQLSPTKHKQAEGHYLALCDYVSRPDSPLHGKVLECFASGSFGTGTVVATNARRSEYDIDVVIELDIPHDADPEETLSLLFAAINGDEGSMYRGMVQKNSRCVTVKYADGVKVDLMPVARLPELPERSSNLFHFKGVESYHKPVDPYDFRDRFNAQVEVDRLFVEAFQKRAAEASDTEFLVEAGTEEMPGLVPIEQKSPLVVAIQLIKRNRDIRYRVSARKEMRKPPSVAINAMALEMPVPQTGFTDVVISLAQYLRKRIVDADKIGQKVEVVNPAWERDIFTDRWPEDRAAQRLFAADLQNLVDALQSLKRSTAEEEVREILKELFGETVASFAMEKRFRSVSQKASSGGVKIGTGGSVVIGTGTGAKAVEIPRNTNFGEGSLPD